MKQDFVNYISQEFNFSNNEIKQLEEALNKPLKKSIRINTNRINIKDFKALAKKNSWTLSPTPLGKNMFYIDRDDTTIALWNTPEHLSGLFYVQEVSASSSPYFLSSDTIDTSEYTILDMSASPGWKTTQLAEYFPNSLIIANEIDKTRLKWLFSNIDRMWATNVVCTNYDWRHFKKIPEIFDKVLLDAPCSWEWTGFKTDDALKYWNIKNIKRIAKLQFWLLEWALKTCKPGGEIVYSTCTLNNIENEWVLDKLIKKYWEYIEIIPLTKDSNYKRNWPHKDLTGWFFVAKIKKIKSLEETFNENPVRQNLEKLTKNEEEIINKYLIESTEYKPEEIYLYKFKQEIYLTTKNINHLKDKIFFYKIGVSLWKLKDWRFTAK